MKNTCCLICKQEFSHKGIHTHYDRVHLKKQQYGNGYNGKYKQISQRYTEKREHEVQQYVKNPKMCAGCGFPLEYNKKPNKFCSRNCSASFHNLKRKESGWSLTEESKNKISKSLQKHSYMRVCKHCEKEFNSKRNKKYCSPECVREEKLLKLKPKARYRRDCQFLFSLNDFPDRFDFSLIEQYGWYSAPNRGNNPNGVSRDHMISIDYGWRNAISPNIISHPANCQLLQHTENWNKREKCSITIEELYKRIDEW